MPNDDVKISALVARISSLEREQKRQKAFRLIPWIVLAAAFALGQSPSSQRSIEAKEFIVHDNTGNIRAKLNSEGLQVFDEHGHFSYLQGGMLMVFGEKEGEGKVKVAALTGSILRFSNGKTPISQFSTDDFALHMQNGPGGKAMVILRADNEAGSVFVRDAEGYVSVLGKNALQNRETGSLETTSASSLVFFDPQEKVIWRAPE